ncbi:TKL protein kinase [Phytophthora cinnamomi]|uniref:TKL protein kinase n=1 Tax=Phytophthora cinnamomi TaxID=4785 RepID=UPI00355ABBFC|nr:TKL protein kinase [Phytophthora cinnamomi]
MAGYQGSECNEAALYATYARPNGGCEDSICYEYETDQRAPTECSKENYLQDMRGFFGSSSYITHEV